MHTALENNGYDNIPKAFSKVSLLFVLVVFIYLSILNIQIYLRNKDLVKLEDKIQSRLIKEQAINKDLKRTLLLFSDSINIEILAREKLGFIKANETAYRIY